MENKALGKKQSISNDDWIIAMGNIENSVSKEELDLLVAITVDEIKKTVKNKNVAYAWSGGKDSLVLGVICEMAGISNSVIGVCDLEYRDFIKWIEDNKPQNCTVINTGQNLDWLKAHPNMLFPQDSATAAKWFAVVQHTAQRKYYKEKNLDMILLGRRKADGNYVGRKANTYTDEKDVTRYSPIADWKHEQVLAFIHYYKLAMPPIYDWYNGYKCGTHPWPARQHTQNVEDAWQEVIAIQPDLADVKRSMEGK